MTPKRIQRRRVKGWKMPPNTLYVGRPTKWGNPWHIETALKSGLFKPEAVPQVVVTEFEAWLTRDASPNSEDLGYWLKPEMIEQKEYILSHLSELRGKDLACFCPLDKPCHADVLLRLANHIVEPATMVSDDHIPDNGTMIFDDFSHVPAEADKARVKDYQDGVAI